MFPPSYVSCFMYIFLFILFFRLHVVFFGGDPIPVSNSWQSILSGRGAGDAVRRCSGLEVL